MSCAKKRAEGEEKPSAFRPDKPKKKTANKRRAKALVDAELTQPQKTDRGGSPPDPDETNMSGGVPASAVPAEKQIARPSAERRREDRERLHAELTGLRGAFTEIAEQFTLKYQSRISELQARVSGLGQAGELVPPLAAATTEQALALLAELQLKPRKGRMKDVVSVVETINLLRELMLAKHHP